MKKANKHHVWRSWVHTADIAELGIGNCGQQSTYVAIILLYVLLFENGFQLPVCHKQANKPWKFGSI